MFKLLLLNIVLLLNILFSQEIVAINQLGYLPGSEKYFVTNIKSETFSVVSQMDGMVIYSGEVNLLKTNDASTGMTTFVGYFSELNKPGEYYIKLDSGNKSVPFKINSNLYKGLHSTVMKSFYLQRCGSDLPEKYAGKFAHPACHTEMPQFHPATGMKEGKDIYKGWHDAGDYGRYIISSSVSAGMMLGFYEIFPEKFGRDDLNIPESGNGIPDYLDEIKYQLEWTLKMQDKNGGVYYMTNTPNYTWSVPHKDKAPMYIFDISSVATGDFAAITALAARIYKKFDKKFSDKLITASEKAWKFLEKNPGLVPENGFIRPDDCITGGYADYPDRYDTDERIWAAVELFLTTGSTNYKNYLQQFEEKFEFYGEGISWGNVIALPKLRIISTKNNLFSESVKEKLEQSYLKFCRNKIEQVKNDGFYSALNADEYDWGSNGKISKRGILFLLASKLTGEKEFENAAKKQLNYILGINGNNKSFVARVGKNAVKHIHHAGMDSDGIDEMHPGLLSGGPNSNITNDTLLVKLFDENTPPALCFTDDVRSYASNENCILYSAPFTILTAYFEKED